MAFQLEDLENLEAAIAQGVTRVKYTDKEVEYRSINEMVQIRNMMRKELGILPKGPNRKFASISKGLDHTGRRERW